MNQKKKQNKFIICRDIYGKKHKRLLKDCKFRPSIYAVIIKNDKILLSPQWDGYDFPGGGMDLDESLSETFEREVFEETGLKVEKGELISVEDEYFLGIFNKNSWHSILIYCLGKNVKGTISDKNFDGNEKKYLKKAEWINLKDIKKVKLLKFYNSGHSIDIIEKALKILNYKK